VLGVIAKNFGPNGEVTAFVDPGYTLRSSSCRLVGRTRKLDKRKKSSECIDLCAECHRCTNSWQVRNVFLKAERNAGKNKVAGAGARTDVMSAGELLNHGKHMARSSKAKNRKRLGAFKSKSKVDLADDEDLHQTFLTTAKSIADSSREAKAILGDQIALAERAKKGKNQKGFRWNPITINWCLWKMQRGAGALEADRLVFTLPSERTLRMYRNRWHGGTGLDRACMESLKEKISGLGPDEAQRLGILSFDGLKIRGGLVYDEYLGKYVGVVDFADLEATDDTFMKLLDGKIPSRDASSEAALKGILAEELLVFYWVGAAKDTPHFPVCCFTVKNPDAKVTNACVEQALLALSLVSLQPIAARCFHLSCFVCLLCLMVFNLFDSSFATEHQPSVSGCAKNAMLSATDSIAPSGPSTGRAT
jgi:hypothetical protein